jgi:hypothetical protein
MTKLADGSTVSIHRAQGAQGGYVVAHTSRAGITIDEMRCDNMDEARAAMHYGPDRW